MKARWMRWCLLGVILAAAAGCPSSNKILRPPKPRSDEYILPPSDDPRFSAYPTYPSRVMDDGRVKMNAVQDTGPGGTPPGFSSQPH